MANKLTKIKFICNALEVHGDQKYDYTNTFVTGRKSKVEIFCISCNEYFTQSADNHLCGSGCPKCAIKRRVSSRRDSKDEFIEKAIKKHGQYKYDYSDSNFINSRKPILIKCLKHGTYFKQKPNSHLNGHGCPTCGRERVGDLSRKSVDDFILQAISIHGDKFDYSKVEYKSAHDPVLIICDNGHENYQTPANHLHGSECRACKYAEREGGFTFENAENDPEKYKQNCIFYRVKIRNKNNGKVFEKVGITTRTIKERFYNDTKRGFCVDVIDTHEGTLLECMDLESLVLFELKDSEMLYKIHDLKEYSHNGSGWSECYYPKPWYN